MYNIIIGRCQKTVADASGLLQRICILYFCGLCRVCGCRVRRARAIRITRLRSRASEREKKRSSLAFLLHRTTILLSKTNGRCAVVAVLTTVRSSWWCAAELYRLRLQRYRCRTANVFLFAR